jgi:type IV secretory pathway VirB2 component (pilin)
MQNLKWSGIYLVGVIIGIFGGANIIGTIFDNGESEDFMPLFYGALLGIAIVLIIITSIKAWLSRKAQSKT